MRESFRRDEVAEAAYIETCTHCNIRLDLARCTFGEQWWKCRACGYEEYHHYRPLILKDSEEGRFYIFWKSGSRRATMSEVELLRQFWPAFSHLTADELMARYADDEEVELGVFKWPQLLQLFQLAASLGLYPSYDRV